MGFSFFLNGILGFVSSAISICCLTFEGTHHSRIPSLLKDFEITSGAQKLFALTDSCNLGKRSDVFGEDFEFVYNDGVCRRLLFKITQSSRAAATFAWLPWSGLPNISRLICSFVNPGAFVFVLKKKAFFECRS